MPFPHLGGAGQPAAGAPGGVQDPHRAVSWPGVAQELVVVLVHGRDEHVALGAVRCQGGDHVVGFGVVDLDPGDGEQVQARLDGGQGADRLQRLVVGGPVGLVAGIGLLALRGAVLAVEHDDDLGPAGQFLVDALAQQGEEHELGRQVALVVRIAGPDLGRGAEAYLAGSSPSSLRQIIAGQMTSWR